MIRRDAPNEIWLIAQHDHALLAGELLNNVGNALFSPPTPFQAVISATSHHDVGWQSRDAYPSLNFQNRPAHVFEINIEIALAAWQDSVSAALLEDPYSALLVSLHAMNLAAGATAKTPPDAFRLQQFFQRQAELQESLRKKLGMRTDLPLTGGLRGSERSDDEELLASNFHLLQLFDQLSLVLCFDRLVFKRIGDVYPRPMEAPVTIRLDRTAPGVIRIDPWPFAVPRLNLQIPAKRLPDRRYPSESALADAYAKAKTELLHVQLKTWQEI